MFFIFAILIGLYSYSIFILGLAGLLSQPFIGIVTSIFFVITFGLLVKKKRGFLEHSIKHKWDFLQICLVLLLIGQAVVNLIGTLGPELAFDALWYHLTLPKIWLEQQQITFIPGGLLYYSVMPKLGEMLYIPALVFQGEIFAKIIHFSFGILTTIALFQLSRRFLSRTSSLLACVIFYANLVVAWESITAYIDLIRAFFEVTAFIALSHFFEERKVQWLFLSAILLGFAITTKLLALGSLALFLILLAFFFIKRRKTKSLLDYAISFTGITLLIPFPWFIFSYLSTGNPVYPFFTALYPTAFSQHFLNPVLFFADIWRIFTASVDPISPLYLMLFPFMIYFFRGVSAQKQYIFLYSLLGLVLWFVTPQTGGGRFLLPYLPVLSIAAAISIAQLKNYRFFYKTIVSLVIIIACISIGYRAVANMKYVSVIIGKEEESTFLARHLRFDYGDFYDTDGYFTKHITENDRVLLYGFHNLYYVDFPFIDSSWVKKGDTFTHIAVQKGEIPKQFSDWDLVYYNEKTMVKVYTKGNKQWVY